MTRLREVAAIVRSKNAGPLYLTLDVMLPTDEAFRRVRRSGILAPDSIAALYGLPARTISTIEHPTTRTLKVTIVRPVTAGDPEDTDLYGAQQYVPLLDLEVPE